MKLDPIWGCFWISDLLRGIVRPPILIKWGAILLAVTEAGYIIGPNCGENWGGKVDFPPIITILGPIIYNRVPIIYNRVGIYITGSRLFIIGSDYT